MLKAPQLASKRCIYREITLEDAEYIVALRANYSTYKYFLSPKPLTMEEHLAWFNNKYLANPNRTDWMVILKESSKPIGIVNILRCDKVGEVGILIDEAYRGRGFAREALGCAMNYGFNEMEIDEMIAMVHEDNINSIKLFDALGFRKEKAEGAFGTYKLPAPLADSFMRV